MTMIQTNSYTFKYNSDEDSNDLNTLLLSQIHFSTILNEIKAEVASDADLTIKIKPLSKGSVPFDINLVVSYLENLLSHSNVDYAGSIITILTGLIGFRIWLKGKKPDLIEINDDKVTITKGDTKIVINRDTYRIAENNEVVDKALQKGFDAIEKDESITGVDILDNNKKPLITIPREDFSFITSKNEQFETITETETPKQERLTIFKIIFDKGYKWQFYLNGRKITATVSDDNFMERVNKGERFAKGDILVVDLEKHKVFDKTMDIFIEKDFKVLKVIEHIPRPREDNQTGMFS